MDLSEDCVWTRRQFHRHMLVNAPDWRWRRAHDLMTRDDPSQRLDDPPTLRAYSYLVQLREGSPLPRDTPITQALEIYRTDAPPRWKLEALLVARQSSRTIAARLNLDRTTVKWYWALFYDARTWMRRRRDSMSLFGCSGVRGIAEGDLDGLWKYVAARDGLATLDRVLAVTTGEGSERYPIEELDQVALYVESLRLPLSNPEHLNQLCARDAVEAAGLPPSAYHRRSRSKRGPPKPVQDPITGEMLGPNCSRFPQRGPRDPVAQPPHM